MWLLLCLRLNVESDLGTHHQQHSSVHGTRHFLEKYALIQHTHCIRLTTKFCNDFSNDFLCRLSLQLLLLYPMSDQKGVET